MRDLLRRMVPTSFEDISAVLALYRPGPMSVNAHNDYADRKNGRQEVRSGHGEHARRALVNGSRKHLLTLDEGLWVTLSSALIGDLKALLGPGCLSGELSC